MIELPLTKNIRTILLEIGQWAEKQPWGESSGQPRHAPELGIGEELGELLHGVLKNYQGIRGFDDAEKFHTHTADAIGDMLVYLSHWCYLKGAYFTLEPGIFPMQEPNSSMFRVELAQAYICLSRLTVHSNTFNKDDRDEQTTAINIASMMAKRISTMADLLGFNAEDCLIMTWHTVKQRNWNKDKQLGGSVACKAEGYVHFDGQEAKCKICHPELP